MNPIQTLYNKIEQQHLWSKLISLKRNEFLKMSGTTDTNLYFIVSGSVKVYMEDAGEEHIIRFGYQNNFIAALDSVFTEKPSEFCIQAIKQTTLKVIHKADFFALIHSDASVKALWDELLQQLVLQQLEREKDILTSSPQERYLRVLKRSPQLFQEIPHKHIASYLSMSPETLSRVKSRLR